MTRYILEFPPHSMAGAIFTHLAGLARVLGCTLKQDKTERIAGDLVPVLRFVRIDGYADSLHRGNVVEFRHRPKPTQPQPPAAA